MHILKNNNNIQTQLNLFQPLVNSVKGNDPKSNQPSSRCPPVTPFPVAFPIQG